jgi:quinol monooxygenase YgiN
MTTLVLLELRTKADSVAAFMSLLTAALPDTRAFDGCRALTVHVNQEDSQNFVFVEHWASYDAYQKYLAWRTENGSLAQLMSLLDGPPTIRCFDAVNV